MRLLNKKALVTGSSRGIGKAIALALSKEGAEVMVHYNKNREDAEDLVKCIRENGGISDMLQADLSDYHSAVQLGEEAWHRFGRLDILVNNAGVSYKKNFLETTLDDFDLFTSTNFRGTLFLSKVVANKMMESKLEGSIFTITSINAIQPGPGFSVYGATKGALETLMKGVALELAPYNIRVNTIAVGAVETDINSAIWKDETRRGNVEKNIPMGRFGKAGEVAAIVCDFLSSGTYMTGNTIIIDGGWLLKNGNQY
jgi:glucose 1-dehydrogenase